MERTGWQEEGKEFAFSMFALKISTKKKLLAMCPGRYGQRETSGVMYLFPYGIHASKGSPFKESKALIRTERNTIVCLRNLKGVGLCQKHW